MVSFSCEACGDVLTKKKLDPHRNQCRGASFTCLDCMVHFQGVDYRAHTSCISEAQKYQGALYRPEKEKKSKNSTSKALVPQKAYVEDVPEDYSGPLTIVEPPPQVPSPPLAATVFHTPAEPVNVFDYLVGSETPNPSTLDLAAAERQRMLEDRPDSPKNGPTVRFADDDIEGADHSLVQYGSGPVPTSAYRTPAPKVDRERRKSKEDDDLDNSEKKDKKRKRLHVEVGRENGRTSRSGDGDEIMTDAPPVLHTGLTGGLNKLLSRPSIFPPSPDYSGGDGADASPGSPLKRTKHSKKDRASRGDGISNTIMSLITTGGTGKAVDENRKRKSKHKSSQRRQKNEIEGSSQKMIEYKPLNQDGDDSQGQMVLYEARADLFMSLVTKGPESSRGCSMNKALKRYHRERTASGATRSKGEEEKELWRSLRLKRNDRGEIVLMASGLGV